MSNGDFSRSSDRFVYLSSISNCEDDIKASSVYPTPIYINIYINYIYNLFTCAEDESEVNMEQEAFALDQYVIEMTITNPKNVPEKLNKRNRYLKMDYGSPHVRDKILYYD